MRSFTLGIMVLSLLGCSSSMDIENTENSNVMDLTKSKLLVEKYWENTKRVAPLYPVRAAKKGISGCVEFEIVISSKGQVSEYEVIKSIPEGIFNVEARKALKEFKWTQTKDNLIAQPVRTTLQLDFSVEPFKSVPECAPA
ncbi:energy transducer TonB [Pseudoalteromonas luteoviolacea]|uniref:energy transducer TonB n=1 Tax=Pseudoalteromonas luteoviolacea TaxID=43657 RepID=UPI001F17FD99|nr:energy transducer TonB [Pseudoalteromonas luteoviolacea]MCF6442986.1 energy transducer TonB [Pseudoalteromonas luteoviolacea]